MPVFNEILQNRAKKPFKKREYRSWNPEGTENPLLKENENKNNNLEEIYSENFIKEVETENIFKWDLSDRPENELGDIDSLANDFLSIGQQQPCIVRGSPFMPDQYELIVGERRWMAAKKANIKLKVIIKTLSNSEAALIQSAENDNRLNLSDYAKGMSFSRLIENGIIKQNDLVEKLGKSKQYVSSLLSFSKIPDEIISAIGNMSKVSARTAEEVKQLSSKGQIYSEAIIKFAPKLRTGKSGQKSLRNFVLGYVENTNTDLREKSYSVNSRKIFTIKKTGHGPLTIVFSRDTDINSGNLDSPVLDKICKEIAKMVDDTFVRARGL